MRYTRKACAKFVSKYLLILGAIALTGCGTTGPIDQHGNTVTPEQERKYALVVLDGNAGFYSADGKQLLSYYSINKYPNELNVEPGFHRIEAVDSEMHLITYGLTVEAGYRYVIPFIGVSCDTDASLAHEIAEAYTDRVRYGRTPEAHLDMSRVRNTNSSGRTVVVAAKEKDVVVSTRDDLNHRELYRLEAIPTCDTIISYQYFSNAERLAWLEEQLEEQRVNNEAEAQRLLAEEKRVAYKKTLPALLEKAWACDPILHTEKVVDWKFRQTKNSGQLETKDEAYERLHQTLVEFRGCQNQADTELLRRVFIRAYVCGYTSRNSEQGRRLYNGVLYWLERPTEVWEPRSWDWDEFEDTILNEVYPCRDGERRDYTQEFSDREGARRQQELALRKVKLKAGEIAIANFDDAMSLLEPKQLDQIMASPLLKADNNLYASEVRVDGNDEHMLRAAIGGGRNFFGEWVGISYVDLKISKSVTQYLRSEMRIGGIVKVIGRYVGNTEYRTIGGEVKIMPVLDVLYLSN